MPEMTLCPRCNNVGFVRLENIVKANDAFRHFYCGACGHQWQDDGTRQPPTKTDYPDRSR